MKLLGIIVLVIIAGAAWIRLAPSNPEVWHLDPNASGFTPPENAHVFCPGPDSRYGLAGDIELAPLIAAAEAWPQTKLLAGSEAEGRLTYITRSKVMGFPDYTTIAIREVNGTMQPCLIARQRFGLSDFGVNAARVNAWVEAAYGAMNEPPPPRVWSE